MTVDSELNRSEIYRAIVNKRDRCDTHVPSLLIAKDIENLETERLKSIEFFDESRFIPVVLEDVNTIRKIFNYNFKDEYYLFDFFGGTHGEEVDIYKIDSLCREMREEIVRQEVDRMSNESETDRVVIRTSSAGEMSDDYARRLYEQFSNCQPLTEVSGITVTDENRVNVRGTWFV